MADAEVKDLTIDELAHETGMSARNIRAHQSRGLLPPPTVRARTGYYGPEHLSRIKLIQDMQGQGFNLKAIERLIELGAGGGSEQALQFERALLTPFGTETADVVSEEELVANFGAPIDRKLISKMEKLGLLREVGEGVWEVPSPTLWKAGRELIEIGIPLSHALAVAESIDRHTSAIAKEFVRLFVKDVLDPLRKGDEAADGHLAQAGEALSRLRPLASEAVQASFAQVMTAAVERAVERELGR
jgi:DNA-binding transcriptional MerR regulator